jgi:hypothetical protein
MLHIRLVLRAESSPSAVGIATVYGLDHRAVGVQVPVGQEFSPHPGWLWGPLASYTVGIAGNAAGM